MAVLIAVFLAFWFVLGVLRDKPVLRAVVITIFFLLYPLSGIVVLLIWNFAFPRKGQGPYHLTVRELVFGDPSRERQRLLEKLQLAMLTETDPQVRQAYAESIAALNGKLPAAKVVE
jgi:ABC-type sugar transport system permease subunit